MAPFAPAPAVTCGRRSKVEVAQGAVRAAVRLAGDKLAAASMRLRGSDAQGQAVVAPHQLADRWRAVALADMLPVQSHLQHLCYSTLSGWARTSLPDRILILDAWGFVQAKYPSAFVLPRPLLRAMATALWRKGSAASLAELNLAAVRTAPFMKTQAADLATSILDAVIHHCAVRCTEDFKVAASLGPVLSMGAFASRTPDTQGELHLLRQAASDARNPLEEAIYQRVAWLKSSLRCDSFTARNQVAASLARDSIEHGGDIRATFITAFGHAPEEHQADEEARAATEEALEEWRSKQVAMQAAMAPVWEVSAAAAAGQGPQQQGSAVRQGQAQGSVEPSSVSMYTVHSDGRSEGVSP